MAWVYLILAGLAEVVWAISMKFTESFTRLWPSVLTVAFMIVSFYLLALAQRTIPVSTSYPVWTGIGAVGAAGIGMFVLGEPRSLAHVGCVLLIVAGVVGLKFLSPH
jgi:quaternary ammonium compound-resistance protein SugE